MFNRSKATAGGRRLRATGGVPGMLEVLLLAAALFVILVPPYLSDAMAGVDPQERQNAFDSAAPASAAKAGQYQLRCWQHGRLVLEENDVQLPPELAASGMKLRGTDRTKRPIYVAETTNATCLIRGPAR
jgi:hypothetical protein